MPTRQGVALVGAVGLALAIVGSGTSGPTRSFVSPGATLDQGNPPHASACRYTGWVPDDATGWAAQTFIAGVTGRLTDLVVWLRVADPRISVAIAPVDASGQPLVATPLASTSPAAATSTTYAEVAISFSAPARVEAGKQYAIVLASPSPAAPSGWTWEADLGSSTSDPSGTRCADGAYAGGRFWVSSASLGADADFFFQTYVLPARHVTVEQTGTGTGVVQDSTRAIDCGSTCSAEFSQGETVTLSAVPDPGSIFSGWSGGSCTGTGPSCSLTVTADTSVTAEFTRALVALTVHKHGRGTVRSLPAGIACGRACSHSFVPGPVTLTAKPARGWQFARWQGGGCHGTKPVCRLTLARAGAVAAYFTKTRHRKK